MSTQTLIRADPASELEAAGMAARGLTLAQIAARFEPPASVEQAAAAVTRGRHQLAARPPAPAPKQEKPKVTVPLESDELLAWADAEGPARAATLAARARTALGELAVIHERHAAALAQRKVIAALEKRLAEAKAELRTLTAHSAPPAAAPVAVGSKDLPAIRAWAREQGYEVADRGLIATAILEAWRRAHPESAGA